MAQSLYRQLVRRFAPERLRHSRRDFLRTASLAAAGLFSGCATSTTVRAPRANGPRVLVIGGGLAGLSCAYELEAVGARVTVLEARARSGGRAFTTREFVTGKNIELGAELIGANHLLWLAYARKFGLHLRDVTEDETLEAPLWLDGRRLEAQQARAVFDEMTEGFARFTEDSRAIDAEQPWLSPLAAAHDTGSLADRIARLPVGRLGKLAVHVQLSADNAVESARQSYLGNLALIRGGGLEDFWTKTELYRCREGNQRLADELARRLAPDTLHLRSPVRRISRRGEDYVVETHDGRRLEAEHVAFTLPPGVWEQIEFDPPLPADLRPQMGIAVKYFARLTSPFWRRARMSPNAITDGIVSLTWEGSDNQPGPGTSLTAFSGGDAAEECRRRWRADGAASYRAELERVFPDFNKECLGERFMDWPSDPWTGGGYSFPAPGELTRLGPRLREGLGRLCFAGEHTCPAFVGYMEGALQSGVRAARTIAREAGLTGRTSS